MFGDFSASDGEEDKESNDKVHSCTQQPPKLSQAGNMGSMEVWTLNNSFNFLRTGKDLIIKLARVGVIRLAPNSQAEAIGLREVRRRLVLNYFFMMIA